MTRIDHTRRALLRTAAALPLAATLGGVPPLSAWAAAGPRWDRILVLVELAGGNDGLNMVVPYADPAYYRARRRLAVSRDQVLPLGSGLGLNPAMAALMPAWRSGELAVVLGVGYPRPNRSHFRSIEIWDTAADSDQYLDEGWVAQLYAGTRPPARATDAVVIGRGAIGPLAGTHLRTVAIRDSERFLRQARSLPDTATAAANPALDHILRVQDEVHGAAKMLASHRSAHPLHTSFPATPLGHQLAQAAELLGGGAPVSIIKVTHGSFDTHSNQRALHDRLLGQLADALAVFRAAMMESGLWSQVLLMTYSEFGRRVAENGSAGTDHGTAAPHFLLGGRIRGGLYGRQPSLTDLQAGDLKHHVDFRRLYTTVASNWWQMANPGRLSPRAYPPLGCIA